MVNRSAKKEPQRVIFIRKELQLALEKERWRLAFHQTQEMRNSNKEMRNSNKVSMKEKRP